MNADLALLEQEGVFNPNTHVVLNRRWYHAKTYLNLVAAAADEALKTKICEDIIARITFPVHTIVYADTKECQTFGTTLAQMLDAVPLCAHREERDHFTINHNDLFTSTRANHINGKDVLVFNAIIATGATTRGLTRCVRALSGNPVAIASICDRRNQSTSEIDQTPIIAHAQIPLSVFPQEHCPLCKNPTAPPVDPDLGFGSIWLRQQERVRAQRERFQK